MNKLSKPVVIDQWMYTDNKGKHFLTSRYMLMAELIYELEPQSIVQNVPISKVVEKHIIKRMVAAGYYKSNTIMTYANRLTVGIQSKNFGWELNAPELCRQIDLLRVYYKQRWANRFK